MHPLEITAVPTFPAYGEIGVTFCPGKKDGDAMTGGWNRDLGLDLDRVAGWNAACVVTLVEAHELVSLKVPNLGSEVERRHMDWLHLPIRDASVPNDEFRRRWQAAGEGLRGRLRLGAKVLVHCCGGLGRAGSVAARLLVELGVESGDAIRRVRAARPGAIETPAQEEWASAGVPLPEAARDESMDACRDRAIGALLGLAVGDAIGTTLEFSRKPQFRLIHDMTGAGPFRLEPGQWTDDTAMALALAESLIVDACLDPKDIMTRFTNWWQQGTYSCTGQCFDIGNTVLSALGRWEMTGEPMAGSTDPWSAGNGALMRLSPVAIRHWRDPSRLSVVASKQTRTTHGALEAVEASRHFAACLADTIAGRLPSEVFRQRSNSFSPKIAAIAEGAWRGQPRDAIRGSGYVVDSLKAALWAVSRTANFRSAVLLAANLGEDADTTAAIVGQLAGALYGASGIPEEWLGRLAWRERIASLAERLFDASIDTGFAN